MSLATDILKRANTDLSPPSKSTRADYMGLAEHHKTKRAAPKGPRVRKPKGKTVVYAAPPHEHIKEVSFNSKYNRWDSYFFDGKRTLVIGRFATQERAHIALRIYRYWRKLGLKDIPNKPTIRTYAQRIGFI